MPDMKLAYCSVCGTVTASYDANTSNKSTCKVCKCTTIHHDLNIETSDPHGDGNLYTRIKG